MVSFKKMRRIASRGGFMLLQSSTLGYKYTLVNCRTRMEHDYPEYADLWPDIEEIVEGGTPFA